MAFSNVAVCLPGCSPGNESFEFEQGSTNHFIKAIIVAVSAVSVESALIQKQCVSQATVDSSQSVGLFDGITVDKQRAWLFIQIYSLGTNKFHIFLLDGGYAGKH